MNVFDIGIVIHLVDKASHGLGALGLSFAKSEKAAAALKKQMQAIQSTFNSGLIVAGGGMALAAPLMMAANKAEELEFALNRVQTATGASNDEMVKFNQHLSKVANMTGVFSKPKLAEFAYAMRESGIMTLKDINENIEQYAKGADVLSVLSKGRMGFEQSAHAFSAIAHHYGYYKKEQMEPVIDAAVKLAAASPGGISTFQKMGANIDVIGNRILKMDPRELMALEAAIAQTTGSGGAGKGALSANNVINAFKRSMPGVLGSGMLHGASAYSASVLGLADKRGFSTVMKDGKMNADLLMMRMFEITQGVESAKGRVEMAHAMLQNVNKLGKGQFKDQSEFAKNVIASGGKDVSGAQMLTKLLQYQAGSAAGMLALMGDPKFLERFRELKEMAYNSKGSVDQMQEKLSHSTHFQNMRAATNIETLMSSFGMVMLPHLKNAAVFIADMADKLNAFVEKHPKVVQAIAGITAGASALMVLAGTALMGKAAWMGLKLVFGPIGTALKFLGPLFSGLGGALLRIGAMMLASPLAPWLLAAMAAAIALALVIKNWKPICEWAAKAANQVAAAVAGMAAALAGVVGQIGKYVASLPGMSDVGLGIMANANKAAMAARKAQEQAVAANAAKEAGVKAGQAAGRAPVAQTANVTQHFHGNVDEKKVKDATKQAIKESFNPLGHIATAVSRSGGVHKSRYAYGAGR